MNVNFLMLHIHVHIHIYICTYICACKCIKNNLEVESPNFFFREDSNNEGQETEVRLMF